ncbi:chloride channel protein [Pseudonocardia zijingensis]|uniref:Chloride channel protein n=1 Tax=Pseudonocardia zijingensis TaxID=153376 RepID=A0ABN1P1N3_9PSEU
MADGAGGAEPAGEPARGAPPPDPADQLRSAAYLRLLLLAAVVGAPISAAAYYFLHLVDAIQEWVYTDLPRALGFSGTPLWWPLPLLGIAGLLVGLMVRHLPGGGGHSPLAGFASGHTPHPADLPGILLAAITSLGLGAVLGPEAPLIALGGGLAVLAVRLSRRDVPDRALAVVASAGSFAAISALLGSPVLGAFLLMESAGLGGPILGLVLLPGLLASGIGALVFVGLNQLSGLGTAALELPGLPPFAHPDIAQFGWALVIGVLAAFLGSGIRRLGTVLSGYVERRIVLLTTAVGLGVAVLAMIYTAVTGHGVIDVLGSGEEDVGLLLQRSADYSVGALLLLVACKGLAYSLSLSAFRGGPVFPAIFIGAAGGVAMSHLPGLPMVAGVAMGIGAMSVVMLKLPLTSVMLATLLMFEDGLAVTPIVIVAVVVAHVVSARLGPRPPAPQRPPGDRGTTAAPAREQRPAT